MPDEVIATEWYKGADAETIGHIQTKGWDKKTPAEAAFESIKAHREAEKLIGVPANEMIRLPKEPGAAEWGGVWERLGAPKDKAEYDLSGIEKKAVDGKVTNQGFVDAVRNTAAELRLPKDMASRFAAGLVKQLDSEVSASDADRAAALIESREALMKNWGNKAEANMFVAKQAAARLGVTPETVTALESVVGYDKVMELFRAVGVGMGEAKFVDAGNGTRGDVMTREQAVSRKSELMADTAWRDRYLTGSSTEVREMTALNTLIVGDDTAISRSR